MNKRVADIMAEARKLTPEEQAELVELLRLELVEGPAEGTPEDIEAAWAEECERRIAAAERGETKPSPAEEVHARLRKRLKRL